MNSSPCLKTPCASETQSVGREAEGWAQIPCHHRPFGGPCPPPGHALAVGGGSLCLPPTGFLLFPLAQGSRRALTWLWRGALWPVFCLHSVSSAHSTLFCSLLLFSVLFLASPRGCRHSRLAVLLACLPLSTLYTSVPSAAIILSSSVSPPWATVSHLASIFGGLAYHFHMCWVCSAHLEKPEAVGQASP